MKLANEFIQLPISFDHERLNEEIKQFSQHQWTPHHENFKGNYAIPLLSVEGKNNNLFSGPIAKTPTLIQSPYLQQVIASFGEIVGRSRLMRLDAGQQVPLHCDINYHWYNRVRIHVPIITDEQVIFHCGEEKVHMKAGEAWIFDSWKNHKVTNDSDHTRVHLVIDISGSSRFWQMVTKGRTVNEPALTNLQYIKFQQQPTTRILCENYNSPIVMQPGEIAYMLNEMRADLNSTAGNNKKLIENLLDHLNRFLQDWRQLWAIYAESQKGWNFYHQLRDQTYHQCRPISDQLSLSNGSVATQMLIHCLIDPCFNPEVAAFSR